MATFSARKQDMPPPGGFKPLDYSRIPAKSYFNGPALIATHLAISAGALYIYFRQHRHIEREKIEMRSSIFAITPLLLAERDREYYLNPAFTGVEGYNIATENKEKAVVTHPHWKWEGFLFKLLIKHCFLLASMLLFVFNLLLDSGIYILYLKQLRRNRDAEEKLMANVEGWEVGKWKGERVYKTVPEDTLIPPDVNEYYGHSHPKFLRKAKHILMWD